MHILIASECAERYPSCGHWPAEYKAKLSATLSCFKLDVLLENCFTTIPDHIAMAGQDLVPLPIAEDAMHDLCKFACSHARRVTLAQQLACQIDP